jgi:hypothetical protein
MRRIEKINARARNEAQLSGLPGCGKALVGLVAAWIRAIAGFSAYEAVTENDVERAVREGQQLVCEQAAKQGVRPPGC